MVDFKIPTSVQEGVLAFSLEALENGDPLLRWENLFNGWETLAESVKNSAKNLSNVDWNRHCRQYKFQDTVAMIKAVIALDKIAVQLCNFKPVADMGKQAGDLKKAGVKITAENHAEVDNNPKTAPKKIEGSLAELGYQGGASNLARNLTTVAPFQLRQKAIATFDPKTTPKDRAAAQDKRIAAKQLTTILRVRKTLISRLANIFRNIIGAQ